MTQLTQARTEAERKAATENTYQRKIQELRHAIAFEQNYSKDWILERYLNLAYFGDGAYGIQAASRHYFSVNASQLDTRQAATLAGLVKNPVGFDPTTYKERALARRNVVLNRMAELGVVKPAALAGLTRAPLGLKVSRSRNGCLGTKAPFFCDYVRRYLMADPSLGKTAADRAQLINSGGLTIQTTIDLAFQRAADKATDLAVNEKDQAIGALAMVQPGTGAGDGHLPEPADGTRAQEGADLPQLRRGQQVRRLQRLPGRIDVQGVRPRGGAGAGPADVDEVQGAGADEHPAERVRDLQRPLPGVRALEPRQLDGQRHLRHGHRHAPVGEHLLRPAGEEDRAVRAVRAGQGDGVDLTSPDTERVPSFVLGVAGVSPLEMAGAYATFAARGKHCDTRPVTKILNSDGKVFKDYPKKCQQVMQESTADTVNQILAGVLAPGGFGQALVLNKPAAGKTGTINSNMAVWFNGYTPTLSTAAMIAGANSNGQPITLNGQSVGGTHHRPGVRLHRGRADVGGRHARDPGPPALRVLHDPDTHLRRDRSRWRSPTSSGCPPDGRRSASRVPGST